MYFGEALSGSSWGRCLDKLCIYLLLKACYLGVIEIQCFQGLWWINCLFCVCVRACVLIPYPLQIWMQPSHSPHKFQGQRGDVFKHTCYHSIFYHIMSNNTPFQVRFCKLLNTHSVLYYNTFRIDCAWPGDVLEGRHQSQLWAHWTCRSTSAARPQLWRERGDLWYS